ncbi:MAG: YhcH/YjgK/YiaL family protein [Muribaculaceae bacterium]|nr:YhcH/YjgK/YiaL family protein [Muribaculaceae bacterium]
MIFCNIDNINRYTGLCAGLDLAIEWLVNNQAVQFVKGTYYIGNTEAGEVFAKCEEPALIPREKAALEAHRRYIDIHVPLKGTETIGWAPVDALKHVRVPYDDQRDVMFFGDSAQTLLHVRPGQCCVFFPEDAHAPNIGLGTHRKLCIKIPV